MALVSQAEHARLCGVSRKSVTIWKAQGRLVLVDGLVDHDASYKGEGWHASVKAARSDAPEAATAPAAPTPAPAAPAAAATVIPEVTSSARAALNQAVTRKEDFTGRIRELDFLERAGKLIEIEVARGVLFDEARAMRDKLLNWVPRNAALIAADLGVEADLASEVLTGYVHKLIASLGTPSGDFAKG